MQRTNLRNLVGGMPIARADLAQVFSRHAIQSVEADRAHEFYKSGEELIPYISEDSQPALWVLVTIYHRLLRHIEQRNFDVFSARIGVPAYEKLSILGCGLFKTLAQGVWA